MKIQKELCIVFRSHPPTRTTEAHRHLTDQDTRKELLEMPLRRESTTFNA
jgi:hypothetical protein